jgi:hypothetical protein
VNLLSAQPADEVSGGAEWELWDICYERSEHPGTEWRDYHEERNLIFGNTEEYVMALTYGKVVEKEDGTLVCQLTHPDYPDFLEEYEMYLQ